MMNLPSIRELFPESFLQSAGIRFTPSIAKLHLSAACNFSTSPPLGRRSPDDFSQPAIQGQRSYGRLRMSPSQIFVLDEVFRQTSFPSTFTRRRLAIQLNLTPRKVQVWFQNKRQKLRNSN
ncbi:hypothetical protein DSO57_1016477 [Entomophthora muscae]|uniref:Uncharacterized protein n=1 Tax=Entomophthora muscae TaxID=34485 RepID=A0ACC2SU85_9FUNG|nr:hypothetical protein DSO57_1016477 [Entomophthora muscae]